MPQRSNAGQNSGIQSISSKACYNDLAFYFPNPFSGFNAQRLDVKCARIANGSLHCAT